MFLQSVRKFFGHSKPLNEKPDLKKIRLTVVSFEDDCLNNSGQILAQHLCQKNILAVTYYDELLNKNFLDFESRTFFDLIDTGNQILKKTNSDVLIWGYRIDNKIRLNFQTSDQYKKPQTPFFSLLNSLYLPLEIFQQQTFSDSISELIFAGILTAYNKQEYLPILQQTVTKINNGVPPKNLSVDYMPYILNLLALAYLNSVRNKPEKNDVKIIASLLRNALNFLKNDKKSVDEGLIYTNLGQLFHLASDFAIDDKYASCKMAIDFYLLSQKYFNRYSYPYDFAFTSYRLSELYFDYWKYTSDIQALRDAVFQLREALKIFSNTVFPKIWADIQNKLGLYLSMMAVFSKNDEIGMMAIDNYKNYQSVYTKEIYPVNWAKAEENIANVYFECGKIFNKEDYFEDALTHYVQALDLYDEHNLQEQIRQTNLSVLKTQEYLIRFSQY
ncbi:MAG: hypothetical protein IJF12_01460 [Alphaproteobacteria bacterium]|nr:hypothetical protein [Alphaproteobacteria bacterium]